MPRLAKNSPVLYKEALSGIYLCYVTGKKSMNGTLLIPLYKGKGKGRKIEFTSLHHMYFFTVWQQKIKWENSMW